MVTTQLGQVKGFLLDDVMGDREKIQEAISLVFF